MATYNGQDFTNFRAVNLRGSVLLRLQGDAVGTLGFDTSEGENRAWQFPNKSGTFPVAGTFAVQLATATAAEFSTIVTVSGLRAEDGLIVQLNGTQVAGTTYGFDNSTGFILTQSVPGNGNMTLFFQNLGNSTGYVALRGTWAAIR